MISEDEWLAIKFVMSGVAVAALVAIGGGSIGMVIFGLICGMGAYAVSGNSRMRKRR